MGTRALIGSFADMDVRRGLKVRVGDIVRPLASVFELVEGKNRVVFDSEPDATGYRCYCLDKRSGVVIPFKEVKRAYELEMKVQPFAQLSAQERKTVSELNLLGNGNGQNKGARESQTQRPGNGRGHVKR